MWVEAMGLVVFYLIVDARGSVSINRTIGVVACLEPVKRSPRRRILVDLSILNKPKFNTA